MTLATAVSRLITAWALAGGVLLLLIVIATAINATGFTANMIARNWGGTVPGLSGYEDGVTMLVGVAALAMFPYCQIRGGHAAVDVVMQYAPGWANRAVALLAAFVTAAVALFMGYMLVQGTIEMRGDQTETAVLGWPVWIFMPAGVFSCLLWAIAALVQPFLGEETSLGT